MTNFRIVEDPRIAQVAKICHDEMLAEIGARMATGEDFFHARETVMAERGNDIARTYGKDVATRAMQGVTALAPADMPWELLAAQDRHIAERALEAADFTRGGRHRWTWLQNWRRGNSRLFDRALAVAIGMIVASPVTGAAAAIWSRSMTEFLPAMGWSAGLGVATIITMTMIDLIAGKRPRRIRGTAPATPADLEAQRSAMRAQWDQEAMTALAAQAEADAASKRELAAQRDDATRLKRIADDLEIAARQERRRLGTELPDDPVYVPQARRPYRRRAGPRNF